MNETLILIKYGLHLFVTLMFLPLYVKNKLRIWIGLAIFTLGYSILVPGVMGW